MQRFISKSALKKSFLYKIIKLERNLGKKPSPANPRYSRKPVIKERRGWKEEYLSYIKSPSWKNKKKELWKVRDHNCGCCKKFITLKDSALHHRTYKRLRREENNDLVFLCHSCHKKIHYYDDGRKKSIDPVTMAIEERKLREMLTDKR